MKYCKYCGTLTVPEFTGSYDPDTGEMVYMDVCPILCDCKHHYHRYEYVWVEKPLSWWRLWFKLTPITYQDQRCKRCNQFYVHTDY